MNDDLDKRPGLKERELIRLGACAVCRKPMLGADPLFFKLTISRGGFLRRPIERRIGLQAMLGSGPLAQAMGPDEDLAKIIDGPHDVIVHASCAGAIRDLYFLIPENAADAEAPAPSDSA